MIADYFKFALKNIRKRKLRSWLTILGIVISVAIIFFLISLSVGLRDAVNEQFRTLGTDKFFIMPKGQAGGPGSGGAVELSLKDVDTVEKIRGVKGAAYYNVGNSKIEYDREFRYYIVAGIPIEDNVVFNAMKESIGWKIDEGRFLQKGDTGKAMIGSQYKYNNVFKKPIKAGDKIIINGQEFKVAGILQSVGNPGDDKNVFISYEDFKKLYNSGDRVDQIIVQVEAGENAKEVAERTKEKLTKARGLNEKTRDFEISTPEEILASLSTILNIITAFLVGVGAISLLVGAIGIANTMYTSVLERTKEIGTMKAIGARNSDILLIFLIESGFIGLIGGVIGILIGFILAKSVEFIAISYLATSLLKPAFPLYLIAGSLLFSFLIGSISGLLPARQASKLKPVDALRYE